MGVEENRISLFESAVFGEKSEKDQKDDNVGVQNI